MVWSILLSPRKARSIGLHQASLALKTADESTVIFKSTLYRNRQRDDTLLHSLPSGYAHPVQSEPGTRKTTQTPEFNLKAKQGDEGRLRVICPNRTAKYDLHW
jgi:hypothetical protein